MPADPPLPQNAWDEQSTQDFLRYGRYFVPERDRQIQTLIELLPPTDPSGTTQLGAAIDLCCGEGLLSEAILRARPGWTVYALDWSSEMLRAVQERLRLFGERIITRHFDLFARSWPEIHLPLMAAASSLALHHLDGPGKQALFHEVHSRLAPGGVFVIADLIEPSHPSGWTLAARQWDAAVQEQSLVLDGSLAGFAAFERMRWNFFRFYDPEDIDHPSPLFDQLKWLEAAGFTGVDVFWMHAGHAIYGGWKSA
jgi:tRNA (cmo5U34)-methyltransferase